MSQLSPCVPKKLPLLAKAISFGAFLWPSSLFSETLGHRQKSLHVRNALSEKYFSNLEDCRTQDSLQGSDLCTAARAGADGDPDLRLGSEKCQPSALLAQQINQPLQLSLGGRRVWLCFLTIPTTIQSKKYLSDGDLVRRHTHTHTCEQLRAKLQQNNSNLYFLQLRYNKKGIGSLFLIPGTELRKPMEFPVSCLLYANEVAHGRQGMSGYPQDEDQLPEKSTTVIRVGAFIPTPQPPATRERVKADPSHFS